MGEDFKRHTAEGGRRRGFRSFADNRQEHALSTKSDRPENFHPRAWELTLVARPAASRRDLCRCEHCDAGQLRGSGHTVRVAGLRSKFAYSYLLQVKAGPRNFRVSLPAEDKSATSRIGPALEHARSHLNDRGSGGVAPLARNVYLVA